MIFFTQNNIIRSDSSGDGNFESPRTHGKHQGIDLKTEFAETIYAPENLIFKRISYPYSDLSYYGGIYLSQDTRREWKIFYTTQPTFKKGDKIKSGSIIGASDSISERYPNSSMQDHIHIELRENGELKNPLSFKKKVQ